MTHTTDIQLLGDFVVRQNGQPVTALDSTRLQALLTYLLHRLRHMKSPFPKIPKKRGRRTT